ncbi:MAG: TolC family protein, partial [Stomatobaculum sp.]|nr:TolC family protein [Stomatobaculum sp.]
WHSQLLSIQNAEKAKRLAEVNLAAAQASANVGMGTQIQVLNAQQAVKNAEQTVISATSAADSTRRKLQVMLGWKADAEAEIGEIPEVDITRIDRMDPEADLAKALENNYTLRVNKKKLKNARNGTDVATLNSTIADNEGRIGVSLRNAYQTAVNQKNAYLYNFANAQVTAQTAAQTAQRFGLGTASAVENESAQIAAEQAQIALKQSEYSLFQAMEAYDWAVNGLAAASAGA